MFPYLSAVGLALLLVTATPSAQRCLHGPDASEADRARRHAAITFVQQINAAEAQAYRNRGTSVALIDAVKMADVPFGFVPRLVFERLTYMVSLKDSLDPCGFSLLSDQDGMIYEARPLPRAADESSQQPLGGVPRSPLP